MKKKLIIAFVALLVFGWLQVAPAGTPPPAQASTATCTTFMKYWFANQILNPITHAVGAGVFYLRVNHYVCTTNGLITGFRVSMDYTSPTSLGIAEGWRVEPDPQVTSATVSAGRMYRVNMTGSVRACVAYYTNICGGSMQYYLSSTLVAPAVNGGGPLVNGGIGKSAGTLRIDPRGNFPPNVNLTLCNAWGPGYSGGCSP